MNVELETAMRTVLDKMVPDQNISQAALCKRVNIQWSALRSHIYPLIDAGYVTFEPAGKKITENTQFKRCKERLIVPQQRVRRVVKKTCESTMSFIELARQYEQAQRDVKRLKALLEKHLERNA